MSLFVLKFGGSVLRDKASFIKAAQIIKEWINHEQQVIVVVSAIYGFTDMLLGLLCEQDGPNTDLVLASGEQISCGLMASALENLGIGAKYLCGHDIPILTDNNYGNAEILRIEKNKILQILKSGGVPVIAGFQGRTIAAGLTTITTLGRGGSDYTAVAIAAAMDAKYSIFYKDVGGVFECDPKIMPKAKKFNSITYEEILKLHGKQIMQHHAAEFAMKNNVISLVVGTNVSVGELICDIKEDEILKGASFETDVSFTKIVGGVP